MRQKWATATTASIKSYRYDGMHTLVFITLSIVDRHIWPKARTGSKSANST